MIEPRAPYKSWWDYESSREDQPTTPEFSSEVAEDSPDSFQEWLTAWKAQENSLRCNPRWIYDLRAV